MENEPKKVIAEIDALNTELEKLQGVCDHVPVIKFDNERKSIVRKCEKCEKMLGYPTQQELKESGFSSK